MKKFNHIPSVRQLVIEVERKFKCGPATIDRLRKNQGKPAFQPFEYRGKHKFEDKYYDHNGILSSKGIWVRQREGQWQAKLRQGGDYTNSQFEELSDPDEIGQMIRKCDLDPHSPSDNFGLQKTGQFTTFRETWKANHRFEIVIDTTDFGHWVGEVELEQVKTLPPLVGDDNGTSARHTMASEMDGHIERFMRQHPWAFPAGQPVGKLSAYLEWKASRN